jgi:hypothetical protein
MSVHANAVITIETPIKRPAMKLPECRNRALGFVIIHSDSANDDNEPQAGRCGDAHCVIRRSAFLRRVQRSSIAIRA